MIRLVVSCRTFSSVLVSSSSMLAIQLYFSKILQFLNGVLVHTDLPVS